MASSSSSHFTEMKHEMFISFRGCDTREGFLDHLGRKLDRKGIDAFLDEKLEKGDEMSSAFAQAIRGSIISLIIFSENYAFSKWCLEELVKIIECKEEKGQIVIPVFYNVDPSDVRKQKGTYAAAFAQHEQEFKVNMETLQIWRSALKKAADLSGHTYISNIKKESKLIDEIVKDVGEKLSAIYPVEPKGLVGIDYNFSCIESLLVAEPEKVRVVGLWGIGGIGKTTIAHAAFDKLSSQYESSYFLENVREESERHGLSNLRKELLSKLLEEKSTRLNEKLSRKKVFIVLDDVKTPEQLKYLVKEQICLGPGSRVIVTSRDKHVLTSGGVHALHQVKELSLKESIKLFSLNAFNNSHPKKGCEELSERAVAYAKGAPLAIIVLGSLLHSRSKETWESALEKLKKYPNEQIQSVLKLSYDRLDDDEKNIFLDIAFFYKGEYKDNVIRLLDVSNFFAAIGIESLIDKALIKISNDNIIQMHDLIQEMGWEIVRQECSKDPGRRSRLRDFDEVSDVLKNKKGTNAVEGIILHASHIKHVHFSADTFKNMTKLRIIKFYSPWHVRSCPVHHPTSIASFSDKLRHLECDGYPLKSLPSSFYREMLVELPMTVSQIKDLWKGLQGFVNSNRRNIGGSKQLMELPSFSDAQNLEDVDSWSCGGLCNVPPNILSLSMIVTLNQVPCKDLKTLHCENHLSSRRNPDVSFYFSLKEFLLSSEEITDINLENSNFKIVQRSIGSLSILRRLMLSDLKQKTLPINEFCCLRSLEDIVFSDCEQINGRPKLHILFDALLSLRELFLVGCSNFFKVPDDIGTLSSLRYLGLKGSSIEGLPDSIKHLSMLRTIYLTDCRRLQSIPELPPSIMHLDATNCASLETVFTLKASALPLEDIATYFFSFVNCLKLDEQSLCNIMDNAYFSLKQAVYNNSEGSTFCYPGARVPEWFRCGQMTKASLTIELSPAVDELLGFVFCSVLPRFICNEMCPAFLECLCYFEDGEKLEEPSRCYMAIPELYSDHVFLWYDSHCCKYILEGLKSRKGKDESFTYIPKVSFEFFVVTYDDDYGERTKRDGTIKECGVYPVYASVQPELELVSKTKRAQPQSIDERPSCKKLKIL